MKTIKHIFFDLDHTIWDFEKNSSETLGELFEEFELHKIIDNKTRFLATYHTVNAQFWTKYNRGQISKEEVRFGRFRETLRRVKVEDAEGLGKRIGDEYVKRGPFKTNIFPHTHETLTYLSSKYMLHIITNGFMEVQFVKLDGSDLRKYFDIILCSEEVGVNKPHRKVFETALQKSGAMASESVMIGDSYEADIQGAEKVGMKTIFFDPHKTSDKKHPRIIRSLQELQVIL